MDGLRTVASGADERRICRSFADVAQLVEHFTRNEGVPGSSPGVGSRKAPQMRGFCYGEAWLRDVLERARTGTCSALCVTCALCVGLVALRRAIRTNIRASGHGSLITLARLNRVRGEPVAQAVWLEERSSPDLDERDAAVPRELVGVRRTRHAERISATSGAVSSLTTPGGAPQIRRVGLAPRGLAIAVVSISESWTVITSRDRFRGRGSPTPGARVGQLGASPASVATVSDSTHCSAVG